MGEQRAGSGQGVRATRTDAGDAVIGLDHVPVSAHQQQRADVCHQHQCVELAQNFVGSPVLGELDGGTPKIAGESLQLTFKSILESLGIRDRAGEAADHLPLSDAAHLLGGVLDNGGFAEGYLAISGDGGLAIPADADHCGGANHAEGSLHGFNRPCKLMDNRFMDIMSPEVEIRKLQEENSRLRALVELREDNTELERYQ